MSKFKYNKDILKDILRSIYHETGKIPTIRDVKKPAHRTYCLHFGSWKNALEYALGDIINTPTPPTDYIKLINDRETKLNRIPFSTDFTHKERRELIKEFGSIKNALKYANLDTNLITNEQIIEMYKDLYNKLGRTPSINDVKTAHKKGEICSWHTIHRRFNSFSNFQKVMSYEPCKEKPIKHTKEAILMNLKRAYEIEGERLNHSETRRKIGMTNLSYAYKIVGVKSLDELWYVVENYYNNK